MSNRCDEIHYEVKGPLQYNSCYYSYYMYMLNCCACIKTKLFAVGGRAWCFFVIDNVCMILNILCCVSL